MAVSAHCLDLLSSFHEAFPDCYRESLLMYSRTFSVDLLELTPQAGTRASSLTRCSSPMCLRVISVQVQLLSSVQLFSRIRLFATPWTIGLQAFLSITSSRSLLKLNVRCVDDAIQPSHPLSSPSPPTFNLSQHQDLL